MRINSMLFKIIELYLIVCCIISTAASGNTGAVQKGIHTNVLLLRFDGDIHDSSGNQNDVEILGASFTEGYEGQAIQLSRGGCVRVKYKPVLKPTNALTIEARVFIPWGMQNSGVIVENAGKDFSLQLQGTLLFTFMPEDGPQQILRSEGANGAVLFNRWVHVSATVGNGIMALYIDGREVGYRETPYAFGAIRDSKNDLLIGNGKNLTAGFAGKIDNVRFSHDVSPSCPAIQAKLTSIPSRGIVEALTSAMGMERPDFELTAHVNLNRKSEPLSLRRTEPAGFRLKHAKSVLDVKDLPPGNYTIFVTVKDREGNVLASTSEDFTKLGEFPWKVAHAGISDEVPPPWTPVSVEGTTVKCWGREYRFDAGNPFPVEIVSREKSILAGPITIRGTVENTPLHWSDYHLTMANKKDSEVTLKAGANSQFLALDAKSTIEFDGMMRIDLTLSPEKPVFAQNLRFEIPVRKEFARYFHYVPKPSGYGVKNAGFLPEDGWHAFFKPYLWLGDEDRGICWFAESFRDWLVDANFPAVEAVPEGDRVIIRVSFVNITRQISKPLKLTFGVQATPVRPRPAGWRGWRFSDNIAVHWADPKYSSEYCPPNPRDPAQFQELVDSYHTQGKKMMMYSSQNWMSPSAPEWDYFEGDWNTYGFMHTATDVMKFDEPIMLLCPRSNDWHDYNAWRIQELFKTYNWDGMYFDHIRVWVCNNPLHNECNFIPETSQSGFITDSEGYTQHAVVYSIFELRESYKRVYKIIKGANPDNMIVFHMSTRMVIPLMAFCDANVDGEHFRAGGYFNGDYIKEMDIGELIAEYTGRQWGPVPFFLPEIPAENRDDPKWTRNMMTLLLLHDMGLWYVFVNRDAVRSIWNVLDDFGIKESEFIPYWESSPHVTATGDNIKVSIYYRKGKEILNVIANLGSDSFKTTLTGGDPGYFGIHGKVTVKDGFSNEIIPVNAGTISLTIPAKDFRLIRVIGE